MRSSMRGTKTFQKQQPEYGAIFLAANTWKEPEGNLGMIKHTPLNPPLENQDARDI